MVKNQGFTLFELLLTLGLLSITLAIAAPTLGKNLEQQSVRSDARKLMRLVRLSRQQAVTGNRRVVICSVDEAQHCTRNWDDDVFAFTDVNRDNTLNGADRILYHWQQHNHNSIQWRGFGPGYLRFKDNGQAAENGAFTLCPASGDKGIARQLIINRAGRAYFSRDTDGDGIVEYGRDKEPIC